MLSHRCIPRCSQRRKGEGASCSSLDWMARANETERKRGKEKERKKDLKEKVSRVSNGTERNGKWRARWLEVTAAEIHQMEEITPVSMPGTMTRPADACFCIPALLSSSLVLSFPFLPLFFSSSFFPFSLFFFLPSTPTPSPPPAPDSTRHSVPSRATNGRMGRGALNI